jgi:NADH-quinone oxidoreductase subunit J
MDEPSGGEAAGTVEAVGRELFSAYLLPFELTSFIILAAIIGAVTLAKRRPPE